MGARSWSSFAALVALTSALAVVFPALLPEDALAQRGRGRRDRPSRSAAPSTPSGEATSPPGVDPRLDAEARALFLAGETAYDAGRYEAALEYFTRAHELSGRPGLLFNIASASERLRRDEEALAAYEQYLSELPDAANRGFTEERIAFLQQQLAQEAQLREAAARSAHAPVLPEPRPDPHPELPLDEDEPQLEVTPSGAPRHTPAPREARAEVLEVEEIPVPAPAIPSAALDPGRSGDDRDDREELVEQWWFWTIVGVAVVGTGVGVGAAIAAASDGGGGVGGSPPVTGDFGPGGVVIALEAF